MVLKLQLYSLLLSNDKHDNRSPGHCSMSQSDLQCHTIDLTVSYCAAILAGIDRQNGKTVRMAQTEDLTMVSMTTQVPDQVIEGC